MTSTQRREEPARPERPRQPAADGPRPRRRTRRREPARPVLRLDRVTALDGLRVLSALAVLSYHTMGAVLGPNPGAGVLLPAAAFLFFVISGYVIYRPFTAAHLAGNHRPDIGRFYRARLLRVLPLWALAVSVYLLVNGAGSLHGTGQWVLTYLLLQYPVAAIRYAVVGPAWALSVEWLFYLSAPLVSLAIFHGRRRLAPRTSPLRAEVAVLAVFFVVAWLVPPARPGVAIVIGMGFAVFDVHRRSERRTPTWLRWITANGWAALLATAGVWVLLANYHYRPGLSVQWVEQDPAVLALWVGTATLWFVYVAFGRPDHTPQRQLGSGLAVRLSQLTFGLYLWHSLVLDQVLVHLGRAGNFEAIFYLTLLGSFLLATATYLAVERPAMRIIRGGARPRAAAARPVGARPAAPTGRVARVEEPTRPRRRPGPDEEGRRPADGPTRAPRPRPGGPPRPPRPEEGAERRRPPSEPATAGPPPPARGARGKRYLTALDGLRALCAVAVIIIHDESEKHVAVSTYIYTGALAGPLFMLFFAISGFVLYRAWARKHLAMHDRKPRLPAGGQDAVVRAGGGADGGFVRYFIRRLLRIYPLYWTVATAALIVNHKTTGHHGIGDYLQVYTLSPFPHPNALLGLGLGIVVWTLLIDVVFYIYVAVHGAVVSALLRRQRRLDPFGFECITLLTLATIFPFIHLVKPGPWAALSCLPIGMLFAVVEAWQDRVGRQARPVAWLVDHWWVPALLTVPGYILGTHSVLGAPDYSTLLVNYLWIQLVLVGFGLALLALIIWGPPEWGMNRWLSSKVMVTAGTLTYGTYLWHPVIIALLHQHADSWGLFPALGTTLVCSVLLATVTYRLIEYPLAQARTKLRQEDAAPAPASGAGPRPAPEPDAAPAPDERTDR